MTEYFAIAHDAELNRRPPRPPGEAAGSFYPVSMLSTADLSQRPPRVPDYEAESRALVTLAQEMAASSEDILQKRADTALNLCDAHSAGLSLLEDGDQNRRFHYQEGVQLIRPLAATLSTSHNMAPWAVSLSLSRSLRGMTDEKTDP
jgi:hypothetical protein